MADRKDFDPSTFSNAPFGLKVDKPWGYEVVFTPPDKPYTGKVLHVQAGKRISLQYHDQKQETIMLLHGAGILLCDNDKGELEEIRMEVGKGYSNVPGQRHRLIAIEECDFIEASTPETGTTYRLQDDSGRADESESDRNRQRHG